MGEEEEEEEEEEVVQEMIARPPKKRIASSAGASSSELSVEVYPLRFDVRLVAEDGAAGESLAGPVVASST